MTDEAVTMVLNDPDASLVRLTQRLQDLTDIFHSVVWAHLVADPAFEEARDRFGDIVYASGVRRTTTTEPRVEAFAMREVFESPQFRDVIDPQTFTQMARDASSWLQLINPNIVESPKVLALSKSNPVTITIAVLGGIGAVSLFVPMIMLLEQRIERRKAENRMLNAQATLLEMHIEQERLRTDLMQDQVGKAKKGGVEPNHEIITELIRPVVRPIVNLVNDPIVEKINIGIASGQ